MHVNSMDICLHVATKCADVAM